MAGFIQIVEFKTSRIDEVQALVEERRPQLEAGSTVRRLSATASGTGAVPAHPADEKRRDSR